jgi:orotidine-5'-phosphate decarboxylase
MAKTYAERVAERVREAGNPVCVGMDPVAKKIPGEGPLEERIKRFYSNLLDAMLARDLLPAAVKPNMAYYEGVSLACLQVLQELIRAFRDAGALVILDAKRGDIASTSGAYARSAFQVFGADAVTAAPYMGIDTIKPFQEESQGQGIYILVRTSNPSAKDFQELKVGPEGEPLYRAVAAKLADWNDGNLGAVVGATAPRELRELLAYWKGRGREVPVLIPGIAVAGVAGGQAGSVAEVYQAIREAGSDRALHLINSSSGINYAYEKYPQLKPAEASMQALQDLCEEIDRAG